MSATFDHSHETDFRAADSARKAAGYETDETYWGYVVRSTAPPSAAIVLMQATASLFGAAFAFATVAMWAFGSAMLDDGLIAIRLGASLFTAGISALLLWYASRGDKIEVQVDTSLGEIREVVRNRAGRPSLVGRYGFDSIGSAFIDRGRRRDNRATLVLRFGNTAQTIPVVRGDAVMLEPLRERIGRDLMIGSLRAARYESVTPFEQHISRAPA